jgi:methyl-accepting chemotaxis protein
LKERVLKTLKESDMSSIKTKLYRGVLFVAILLLTLSVGALWLAREFSNDALFLVNRAVNTGTELSALAVDAQKIRRYEKEYFIYVQDPTSRTKYLEEFDATAHRISETLTRMVINRAGNYSAPEIDRFRQWQQAADFYFAEFRSISVAASRGQIVDSVTANAAIKTGKDRFAVVLEQVNKEVEQRKARVAEGRTQIMGDVQKAAFAMFFMVLLGLFLCIWQFQQLYGVITAPLERIVDAAEELAAGRVPGRLDKESASEFSRIITALETVRTKMLASKII